MIKFYNQDNDYVVIMTKQITRALIDRNLEYASQSEVYIGHPMWSTDYPLTEEQCIAAKLSSDTMQGWIRYNTNGTYCDMCTRAIGEQHRPSCGFGNLPVGHLNDLSAANTEELENGTGSWCSIL